MTRAWEQRRASAAKRRRGLANPLLLIGGALALVVTVVCAIESSAWVGRPFAGFLLMANRVIPSAGLARWPATQGGDIYQFEVVTVEGSPLRDASALQELVAKLPVGTPLHYRLRRGDREIERVIAIRRFEIVDFTLLFGAYLACGVALVGTALGIRYLRRSNPMATATAVALWIIGMWAITATDLYGPYYFYQLHAVLECFIFASTLHLALVFPHPKRIAQRFPRLIGIAYGAAGLFAVVTLAGLSDPSAYVTTHRLAMSAFGAALVVMIGSQLWTYLRPPSFEARQRVKVLAIGTVGALGPQAALALVAALTGGHAPENTLAWSGVFFPIAIGYAVLRDDLLGVDALLRRSLNYGVLTAVVALTYAAALAGADAMFRGQAPAARGTFVVIFGVCSVAVLLPLRDRLQSILDRMFFRSAYDFRRLVESTSARLASATSLEVIVSEIKHAAGEALHPEWISLNVPRCGHTAPDAATAERADDAWRAVDFERESRCLPFDTSGGGLAVPFRVDGVLVAMLLLGRQLSARYYGGIDRSLLHTLANHGAVAIQNALALAEVKDLNTDLELRVEERTAKLAEALQKLRDAQAQLVQREKMASIGKLVAGIAHEINNPLNFIQGNLHFLRQYTDTLVRTLETSQAAVRDGAPHLEAALIRIREENEIDFILQDFESVFAACDDGVVRTTKIVKNLRTFSRLDMAEFSSVDLHEALESTLTLLRSRLTGFEVIRDYGELPRVECLGGQINQVFMNLLTNAADAVGERGSIAIRTCTVGDDRVRIEIEDDGCGIDAEALDHIFDPFFTTKEVGRGTGLGLSISYGVITRHGGTIRVRTRSGEGTCFGVELPVNAVVGSDSNSPDNTAAEAPEMTVRGDQ